MQGTAVSRVPILSPSEMIAPELSAAWGAVHPWVTNVAGKSHCVSDTHRYADRAVTQQSALLPGK